MELIYSIAIPYLIFSFEALSLQQFIKRYGGLSEFLPNTMRILNKLCQIIATSVLIIIAFKTHWYLSIFLMLGTIIIISIALALCTWLFGNRILYFLSLIGIGLIPVTAIHILYTII